MTAREAEREPEHRSKWRRSRAAAELEEERGRSSAPHRRRRGARRGARRRRSSSRRSCRNCRPSWPTQSRRGPRSQVRARAARGAVPARAVQRRLAELEEDLEERRVKCSACARGTQSSSRGEGAARRVSAGWAKGEDRCRKGGAAGEAPDSERRRSAVLQSRPALAACSAPGCEAPRSARPGWRPARHATGRRQAPERGHRERRDAFAARPLLRASTRVVSQVGLSRKYSCNQSRATPSPL